MCTSTNDPPEDDRYGSGRREGIFLRPDQNVPNGSTSSYPPPGWVGSGVLVGTGELDVGTGGGVTDGGLGVRVRVGVGVREGVGVIVGERVIVGVSVRVGVRVGVLVGRKVRVGVSVALGSWVLVAVGAISSRSAVTIQSPQPG